MRKLQVQLEEQNMKETSVNDFIARLDDNKSSDVIVKMVEAVEAGIEKYHNSVQRKRAPFFKVTKDLEYSEVAYIGLKAFLGVMCSTHSITASNVGVSIGTDLFIATERTGDIFSVEESIVKEKAASGIKLLSIIVDSLPNNYFRKEQERISLRANPWVISVSSGFEKLRKDNGDLFSMFTRRMMPLVCEPDPWTNMLDGGYLSELAKKVTPLVKRHLHHPAPDGDTVFSGINHIQKTPFKVNKTIYEVCKELQNIRPKDLKKIFKEDLGKFLEECPIDREGDAYIWEKEDAIKVNEKTGKEKIISTLKFQDEDSTEKRKLFFQWTARRDLHKKRNSARKSIDNSFSTTLEVVESLKEFDDLYWGGSLDRRSRVYPSAMTGINLQGADYQKAVVMFSKRLPIGSENGVYAVKKTLCNHWGGDSGNGVKTDKLSRSGAESWISDNSRWIIQCAESPMNNNKWMNADKPLQFLVAAIEWRDWCSYWKNNSNYGFMSHLCDPNDASCSGAQILSAMTRDDVGAMHTNMKANMAVQDLYMAVAKKVDENLRDKFDEMSQDWLGRSKIIEAIHSVSRGEENEILTDTSRSEIEELWDREMEGDWGRNELANDIFLRIYPKLSDVEKGRFSLVIRDLVKKPVMVKFYSGTRYGNIEHCNEKIVEYAWESNFRADTTGQCAAFMGSLIYDSINQVISGAGLVMEWFVHVAEILGSLHIPVKWTTPVGFKATMSKRATKDVRVKVKFHEDKESEFMIKIPIKVIGPTGWVYKLDVAKMKSGIAPDIVHSLDASLIIAVAARCAKEGIPYLWLIHDSMGSHCCYSAKFNKIIREEFVKLFNGDVLGSMYQEFRKQLSEEYKELLMSPEEFGIHQGAYRLEEILNSEFSFK